MSLTLVCSGCGIVVRTAADGYGKLSAGALTNPGRIGPLSDAEQAWARAAWRYVTNNTSASTGLVNSVDRYPATTLWQIGDYLAALVAARELKLIDRDEFDRRLSDVLRFLGQMPLLPDGLPNRIYNTQSGAMSNYANQPGAVGTSAVDVGRLLVWLHAIGARYPEYGEYVDRAVLHWNVCALVGADGSLHATRMDGQRTVRAMEIRPGYGEYASTGFRLWGIRAADAYAVPLAQAYADGVRIYFDARDPRQTGSANALVSAPWLLSGIEFGWRFANGDGAARPAGQPDIEAQADAVYRAQEARWRKDGILTARTDHQIDRPPYFVYDAIFGNGYAWNTIGDDGRAYPELALVATRAAFGMWVLWDTAYTTRLMRAVDTLHDAERGWFEGRYEATGAYDRTLTLSTNAAVLEALLYKSSGRLVPATRRTGYFSARMRDVFAGAPACLPVANAVQAGPQ
ncbi:MULTISPECIES: DUF3131 domain-containing protein [unclassified Burkholderia]|uniref:DUF3131 domain-containing protein n=1 Tax=unclassified Burkholderia TaxID=2613784 RepID=UPI002AB061B9|nr:MULTISPECIES: DUF3131 domain-containing protein [unclassified Burkholderia]